MMCGVKRANRRTENHVCARKREREGARDKGGDLFPIERVKRREGEWMADKSNEIRTRRRMIKESETRC